MKIVFFGTGAFGLPALDAIQRSSHDLLSIVTMPDKPQGRGLAPQPSPVRAWAARHRFPVILNPLEAPPADCFVVIDYGMILPQALLDVPRLALNVHGSLLPRYRGAAPVARALLNGDSQTGVTVIRMSSRLDAGDIALQKKLTIEPKDDVLTLEEKLSVLGAQALIEALDLARMGRLLFVSQDEERATLAPKLKKEDGRIDWKKPAGIILNQIRALKKWPGTYSFQNGKRILIIEASPSERLSGRHAPGTLVEASAAQGILVAAGDRLIRIEKLQMEGRKPVAAVEFLKGFRFEDKAMLE
ncbi:MAG: methionyl-tRNA formyltransferase [Candidatus Omnitrophica bacterium]|nr:methionyl-tRNA formyltransferase [Candidatus Omnitrophota bacterium]